MPDLNKKTTDKRDEARSVKRAFSSDKRRDAAFVFTVLSGFLFGLWYIKNSCCDVAYSDYIRLINSYLPDVFNPDKFFVADIFTRIPASFLQRIINVELFGFSVTFDRLLTLSGFALCSAALLLYARRRRLGGITFAFLTLLLYSLNKWEIYINGSAWAHVFSFGLFFINYYLFDIYIYRYVFRTEIPEKGRIHSAESLGNSNSENDRQVLKKRGLSEEKALFAALCALPFVILMFAGEYIASYAAVMLFFEAIFFFAPAVSGDGYSPKRKKTLIPIFVSTLIPLFLYLISRSFAVWEHAGSTDMGIAEFVSENPLFIPRFFIKSFAGVVFGKETIESFGAYMSGGAVEKLTLLLGALVIAAYLLAIFLYFRARLFRKTVFPMILLLSGGFNHVLVTMARWIFEDESYGLSSRYSAQFTIGILGIFLIYSLYIKETKAEGKTASENIIKRGTGGNTPKPGGIIKGSLIIFVILFLAGNCYTCFQEIKKAPYREQNYEKMAEAMRNHEDYADEELCKLLEWHKDPEILKNAIRILEENSLNVFRK